MRGWKAPLFKQGDPVKLAIGGLASLIPDGLFGDGDGQPVWFGAGEVLSQRAAYFCEVFRTPVPEDAPTAVRYWQYLLITREGNVGWIDENELAHQSEMIWGTDDIFV